MSSKRLGLASLGAAALSSACCWLPLVAISLGFSAAGISQYFEAFRPMFLALAVAFVGGAFLLRRRAARRCGEGGCPPPKTNWEWGVGGIALFIVFAAYPEIQSAFAGHTNETFISTDAARVYRVRGMSCEGCTNLLEDYLVEQVGVRWAKVRYAEQDVTVAFDDGVSAAQANAIMATAADEWSYEITAVADAAAL